MAGPFRAFVALGSNLGPRRDTLAAALGALDEPPARSLLGVSRLYETRPVGPSGGPFLNAVAELRCVCSPEALLAELLRIESALGRVRDVRWGPRTIDLDLVAAQDEAGRPVTRDTPALTLPHPRAHERDFVLRPLCDLAPDVTIGGHPARTWLARISAPAATLLRTLDDWPPEPTADEPTPP